VDLGDGVMGPATGTEPVGTRVEVRLEDRLEDQLHAGLHNPVPSGGDAQRAELAVRFGDHPLPHGQRLEPAGFEIVSQPTQKRLLPDHDGARCHPIDAGRACPSIAPHPIPRHGEEGGIGDEVEQVTEPTIRAVGRPSVQLGLDTQYPRPRFVQRGPRCVGVHRRPPGMPAPSLRARWVPSPCGRLSRPRTTTDPPPQPGAISRR
jgi:hypothetical protein